MSPQSDPRAAACRRLWASVLLAVISDYNAEHDREVRKNWGGGRVLDAARRYLNSSDGQTVAARAGVDLNVVSTLRMIALPRAEFRARLTVACEGAEPDDVA